MKSESLIIALIEQTDHSVDEFTGAAIIQSAINNKTVIKYKVSLYFGYENKKPLTRIIEIDRDVFFALPKALDDYLSNIVKSTGTKVFTMSSVEGRFIGRPTPTSTPTNTNTINTNTLITNTKEAKNQKLIDQFEDVLKPTVGLIIEHRASLNKPITTKRAIDMLIKRLHYYAEVKEISFDDVLHFWRGETWKSIDIGYEYPFRKSEAKKGTWSNIHPETKNSIIAERAAAAGIDAYTEDGQVRQSVIDDFNSGKILQLA